MYVREKRGHAVYISQRPLNLTNKYLPIVPRHIAQHFDDYPL
jgi:hypothetical protein